MITISVETITANRIPIENSVEIMYISGYGTVEEVT